MKMKMSEFDKTLDKQKMAAAGMQLQDVFTYLCDKYGSSNTFDAAAMTLGIWAADNTNPKYAFDRALAAMEHGYTKRGGQL